MVGSRKIDIQGKEVVTLSEADKGCNDDYMDFVHSPEMSVSMPSLEYATLPLKYSNGMFQFLSLGEKIDIVAYSLSNRVDASAHVNVDNAIGADNMALVPFDSGIKATSLNQGSMVQDSMDLVMHESVFIADDGGLWIVASSKCS